MTTEQQADEATPEAPAAVETAAVDATSRDAIRRILEAALLVAGKPLTMADLERLFGDGPDIPTRDAIRRALAELDEDWRQRCLTLQEVASGYRAQVRTEFEPWIARLWEEKAPRYSRALLETLAIIAYRQPMTRSEIEDIRGVAVSSQIIRTLSEREWVRVVGHRETPGRPAMYGTTREFLDYFNLKTLDQMPPIGDIRELEGQYPELGFEAEPAGASSTADTSAEETSALDGAVDVEADSETDANADASVDVAADEWHNAADAGIESEEDADDEDDDTGEGRGEENDPDKDEENGPDDSACTPAS